tara:strand:+ start:108 stop:617 length:510 start_codon:yes stop_codon:yes gene_type:complete
MDNEIKINSIVSNCPLCEEHSLHVVGNNDYQMMQCIHCGYVSSPKFLGTKKDNEEYKKLTEEMKNWAIEQDERIWIPTIMTLPTGMLFPINGKDGVLEWSYAKMVDIPKEEQKNFPIEGQEGKFYERKYDTENPMNFKTFIEAMVIVNQDSKESEPMSSVKLPKLKKIK